MQNPGKKKRRNVGHRTQFFCNRVRRPAATLPRWKSLPPAHGLLIPGEPRNPVAQHARGCEGDALLAGNHTLAGAHLRSETTMQQTVRNRKFGLQARVEFAIHPP